MRLTEKELLEMYPWWNAKKQDICKVKYGDEPLTVWDEKEYRKFLKLNGTLFNIRAVDAFIYTQNGDYCIYDTLVGKIYIASDGRVLSGDINVSYNGVNSIYLTKMYGLNALHISKNGDCLIGFRNADGIRSARIKTHTKEMDESVIEKIINNKMNDYGVSIQKFMESVRETYYADTTNHIMEECFA